MAGHILTLTPTQWDNLQKKGSILIDEVEYQYNEENLYMVVECPFPVGYVYLSVENISPAERYGGSWEQLPEGYALWTAQSTITSEEEGVDDSENTYRKISAGLPNITGGEIMAFADAPSIEGAITKGASGSAVINSGGSYYKRTTYSFDASLSNDIYGKSDTVQPPAYKIYAWKRVP